jgi:multidrug efflux system membrane fusion protein
VTVARTQGNETVIAKGLQVGEKVVTDGQPRLTQGAKIEIRTAGGPGGGGRPPGAAGGERPAGSAAKTPAAERPRSP